jgi:alpha-N-acetylglucosamine transferase
MKTAYVTMLCNGDGYLPGVETLGKSLVASVSTKAMVVLVTPDIGLSSRERLTTQGWEVRGVDPIASPAGDQLLFSRFANVFTKLRVWELQDYDRVVLLDADTLVLQNVDDLFLRSPFAAAPDFFLPDRFNSGVMVIEPSHFTFERMMTSLSSAGSYDGGDQGFLNEFFPDWYAMPVEHRLPVGYNMAHFIYQFLRGHPSLRSVLERDVKIVHYMVQKPWQAKATLTGGSQAWWGMYFRAHPEKGAAWKGNLHAFEDWTFDHLASLVLD